MIPDPGNDRMSISQVGSRHGGDAVLQWVNGFSCFDSMDDDMFSHEDSVAADLNNPEASAIVSFKVRFRIPSKAGALPTLRDLP